MRNNSFIYLSSFSVEMEVYIEEKKKFCCCCRRYTVLGEIILIKNAIFFIKLTRIFGPIKMKK